MAAGPLQAWPRPVAWQVWACPRASRARWRQGVTRGQGAQTGRRWTTGRSRAMRNLVTLLGMACDLKREFFSSDFST